MSGAGAATAPGPVRVLVVDDLPDNVEILRARLESRGYLVATASNGEEALASVHSEPPQLILCDVMMPGIDGYEVSRRIKHDDSLPFIPIILVTALGETEHIVQGLNTGADDYIAKPYHFNELEARVRAMLRIKRLQDELDQKNRELEVANKRLRKLSITDGLTELFNHRHVHELLRDEFERSRRSGEPLGVTMIDLDRFKRSTTPTATPRVTWSSTRPRASCARRRARSTWWGATAARSSSSSSPTRAKKRPPRSPSACGRRWRRTSTATRTPRST